MFVPSNVRERDTDEDHPDAWAHPKTFLMDAFRLGFARMTAIIDKRHSTEQFQAGSTAIVCAILGDMLIVGNVGDCRAVLNRAGRAVELSRDHKASAPEERKRVKEAGGRIIKVRGVARLYGSLAVTRSFGDYNLKAPATKGLISAPEITRVHMLPGDDRALIVASDGLWDVVTSSEAVTMVEGTSCVSAAATKLLNTARDRGAADNITVSVLTFHWDVEIIDDNHQLSKQVSRAKNRATIKPNTRVVTRLHTVSDNIKKVDQIEEML
eukprot:TRINITY_DN16226_c0_g1_i1.p1 TRINITY_DN16226_c0_g1~~TRINITY_DN16226_c0_g1_i1.p1  ORF type:complete len:296 (+),score=95.49 TRINITY_DN16226_c0_g1_i1:85-888(+)